MAFVHLHLHSEYSFLDGSIKLKELFDKIKSLGQNAVAITEHGHIHALVQKYKLAKEAGIKLIIGVEIYVCDDINVKDKKRNHFLLLAENNEGLDNLIKLVSIANTDGFYYKARVDKNILRKYSKGLIASTACIAGDVQQAIISGNLDKAKKLVTEYVDIFGKDNFFLELHNHGIKEERIANEGMIKIANELNVPIIVANDAHYLNDDDNIAHDILLCIQTKKKLKDDNRMRFDGSGFHITSENEMRQLFPGRDDYLENTQKIADRCNVELDLGNTYFPEFDLPKDETYDSQILKLCLEGLDEHYKKGTKIYEDAKERLQFELDVIKNMGFSAYFLIVADFIREAKKFCQVGPGRGCVFPQTKVLLSSGVEKEIKDIKIKDEIVSHKGNVLPVSNIMKYPCAEEIIRMTIQNEDLCITKDHKVWAVKSQICHVKGEKLGICKISCKRRCTNKLYDNYKLQWIEAGNLNKDDFVVFPRTKSENKDITFDILEYIDKKDYLKYNEKYIWYEIGTNKLETKKVPRYIKFNDDLAKIIGFYIAEGWSRTEYRRSEIGFGFHKKEVEYIQEVQFLFRKVFNLKSEIVEHKMRNSIQVCINSKIVGEFLSNICGKGALNKHIHDKIILHGKDKYVKTLISYMFKGDGHDGSGNKTLSIKYSTVSKDLATQLKLLFTRFGYCSNIHKRNRTNNKWNIEYSVKLAGKQLLNWNDDFKDFQIPIKKQILYRNDSFFVDRDYIYVKIKNIKKEEYKGYVYDISVAQDTSYTAHSIAIHNSGAGSIVAYVLGITQLEPLSLQLLFERFLNPERISLPDFDVDFGDRDRVLEYIKEKYGKDKVALIGTYGTMMAKAVIKDVARVIDIPFEIANDITKHVNEKTIQKSLELQDDRGNYINTPLISYKEKYPFLFEIAQKLEGTVRQPGIHACGVVWGPNPIDDYLSVFRKDDNLVTQMDKDEVEARGLVKFDFLGLETLNIIQKILDFIEKDGKWLEKIRIDDSDVYKMLADSKSIGVFQLESAGMQKTLRLVKPVCFDDIIAIVALYRPGSMDFIDVYANRKDGKEEVKYPHPLAEEILKPTYGILVYQEQVMLLSRVLAGFTMGESDVLRKAIGKKKLDLMKQMEDKFKDGCRTVAGMVDKDINALWDNIVKFASYSFNKSHAAAYALISYRTAYLKYHYPIEFYTAIISSVTTDTEKMAEYIQYAKDDGIDILPPSINKSEKFFSFEKNDSKGVIRFGFSGIKNIGDTAIDEIIKNRPYKSYQDLINKVDLSKVNKRVLKHLIMCGAFEELPNNRNELLNAYENITKESKEDGRQKTLFGGFANEKKIEKMEDVPLAHILQFEIETLGLPISGNLLDQYPQSKSNRFDKLSQLIEDRGFECFVLAKKVKKIRTKKGDDMAFIDIEDRYAKKSAVVFPSVYTESNIKDIEEDTPIIIEGVYRGSSLIVSQIQVLKKADSYEFGKKEGDVKKDESKKKIDIMSFC